MFPWRSILMVLACLHAVQSFTCPADSHPFYHADVSTGCQVYHHCVNSHLQTFTCPSGQAFNYATSSCEDASTVDCYETMDDHSHHHHHKRTVEKYHTIDVQQLRTGLKEFYANMKQLMIQIAQAYAPTIYEVFEEKYLPLIKASKEAFLPFYKEKVLPNAQKFFRYFKYITGKIFVKAYKSYELSNSTHIQIASMYDIAKEVHKDIQPYLNVPDYWTTRRNLLVRKRNKREISPETANTLLHLILESEDLYQLILESLVDDNSWVRYIFGSKINSKNEVYKYVKPNKKG